MGGEINLFKILITGASGFIGSHVAERLHLQGHRVIGLDCFSQYYSVQLKNRNCSDLESKGIKVVHADMREVSIFEDLDTDFDYIFHLAAQPGIDANTSFEDYLSNNFIATQNLLHFVFKNKSLKMFVNIATSSIYGLHATSPESVAPEPVSNYGVTKLAGRSDYLTHGHLLRSVFDI